MACSDWWLRIRIDLASEPEVIQMATTAIRLGRKDNDSD